MVGALGDTPHGRHSCPFSALPGIFLQTPIAENISLSFAYLSSLDFTLCKHRNHISCLHLSNSHTAWHLVAPKGLLNKYMDNKNDNES